MKIKLLKLKKAAELKKLKSLETLISGLYQHTNEIRSELVQNMHTMTKEEIAYELCEYSETYRSLLHEIDRIIRNDINNIENERD